MTDKIKIRIVVDENADIVAQLDTIAGAESISRADVLRRAIRRLLLSAPPVPETGNDPKQPEQIAA